MLDKVFLIANEEYLLSQSGGGNDIKSDVHALQHIFSKIEILSLPKDKLSKEINTIKKGRDYIFFSGFLSFERFFSQVKPVEYRENPRITNIKDLHFFRELRLEMLERKNTGDHKIIMERELTACKYSDLVLSYSDDEIKLTNKLNKNINIRKHFYYNPNFQLKNEFKFNRNLVFIGNFEHKPNLDAILSFDNKFLFDSNIFKFKIFGQNSKEKLNNIKTNNTYEIIGEVNNSDECYSEGGLFISPIRFGGGIKIKIIEAALSKLPIIATAESVEGLNLIAHESYIPLLDNISFQNTLKNFQLNDPQLKRIASAGFNAISKISNERLVYENLHALINQIRP